MRDAVRDKGRWERRRAHTQDPSTEVLAVVAKHMLAPGRAAGAAGPAVGLAADARFRKRGGKGIQTFLNTF